MNSQVPASQADSAQRLVIASFVAALVVAMISFIGAATYLVIYLLHAFSMFGKITIAELSHVKLNHVQAILAARADSGKFMLQSCGVVSGMAFGFLGFALFVLGIKGDMDATIGNSEHKVQLNRVAPGAAVMFAAAVLIGFCSTHEVKLSFADNGAGAGGNEVALATGSAPGSSGSTVQGTAGSGSASTLEKDLQNEFRNIGLGPVVGSSAETEQPVPRGPESALQSGTAGETGISSLSGVKGKSGKSNEGGSMREGKPPNK